MPHGSPVSLGLHASHPPYISQLLAERAERAPEALALLAPGHAPLSYVHSHLVCLPARRPRGHTPRAVPKQIIMISPGCET